MPVPKPKKKPTTTNNPPPIPAAEIDSMAVEVGKRQVIYPEEVTRRMVGDKALTEEAAKDLFGWCTDPDEAKALNLGEPMGTDLEGKKFWGKNNLGNRPFTQSNGDDLRQKLLMRRWAGPNGRGNRTTNGEPMIVGATGITLNCQHRLYALITANQEVRKDPDKWKARWPGGRVVMDTLVHFGVEEIDWVINTMDTCKSRTMDEVIYRCNYFRDMSNADRRAASKALAYAIRVLWDRTGERLDAYAPVANHDEMIELVVRLPKLLEAVRHVVGEDKGGNITGRKGLRYGLGKAAALMYLMGTSATVPTAYVGAARTEESLDLKLWPKAVKFWSRVGDPRAAEIEEVRRAMAKLADPETGRVAPTEQTAVLVKAWNEFAEGRPITPASLKLEYDEDERLVKVRCGGIDLGPNPRADEEPPATPAVPVQPPKAKEVKATKKEIQAEREAAQKEVDQEWLVKLRKQHPDKVLMFKSKDGHLAWGKDADLLNRLCKIPKGARGGVANALVLAADLDETLRQIKQARRSYVLLMPADGYSKTPVVDPDQRAGEPEEAEPKANGKAKAEPKLERNKDGSVKF